MRRRVEAAGPHFNRDNHLADAVVRIRSLGVVNAIETGTYLGETTKYLSGLFRHVWSIESNPKYHRRALARLKRLNNLSLVFGDSGKLLGEVLGRLSERVFVFLDAHWYDHCPIEEELATLARFRHLDPVLAIHDFKNPHRPDMGFDVVNGKTLGWESFGELIAAVHGGEGEIFYNNVATGAMRGVIFAGRNLGSVRDGYGTDVISVGQPV